MRIFITGGTGLVGDALIHNLLRQGHQVMVLTRNRGRGKEKFGDKVEFCTTLDSIGTFDDYDAVINLAGEPIIGKRWTKKQKEKLCNSRWNITRKLSDMIKKSSNPPKVFVSGSAVGYYGAQKDNILTESSAPHKEFTNHLCEEWERLALEADSKDTRVCISRTGIVLSKKGGMLSIMLLPFRMGLGSVFGKGKQYISWVHIQDMINAIIFLLHTPEARGIFNITAPNPVTNKRFANVLSNIIYRPRIFRIPAFVLKMMMGEAATMVVDGQRVIPQHLQNLHFRFTFEHLDESLRSILKGKNDIKLNKAE